MKVFKFFASALFVFGVLTPEAALCYEHVQPIQGDIVKIDQPVTLPWSDQNKDSSTIRGDIVKIDQPGNILVVKAGKAEVTLYLVPDTAIRSGKSIKLASEKDAFAGFTIGERIGATYITDAQGKKLAHSILKLKQNKKTNNKNESDTGKRR
jgi:hypothetical protein